MIFNGIEKDYVTVLRGRERPAWASKDREIVNHRLTKTTTDSREISVPVKIDHKGFSDLQKIKEDLAGWLVTKHPKPLEFTDDPNRFYLAVVNGTMDLDEFLYWGEGLIEFVCPDPFKYSDEKQININLSTTSLIGGHESTPWKTKTTFTSAQSSYELQFNLQDKTDLRDICKLKLNYDFIRGDILEIDYRKRRITVNGIDRSNIIVILQSNYMELPIGEVEFEANHETKLFYFERYY